MKYKIKWDWNKDNSIMTGSHKHFIFQNELDEESDTWCCFMADEKAICNNGESLKFNEIAKGINSPEEAVEKCENYLDIFLSLEHGYAYMVHDCEDVLKKFIDKPNSKLTQRQAEQMILNYFQNFPLVSESDINKNL